MAKVAMTRATRLQSHEESKPVRSLHRQGTAHHHRRQGLRVVRQRDMKKPALIVLIGLIVLPCVSSCSSRPLPSVAEVTGFTSFPVGPPGSSPSGPITVRVAGKDASRLAHLVSQLPSVAQSQVHCEEPLGLMYRIVFGAGSVAQSKEVVEGYECAAAVMVAVAGKARSWRRDATCSLIRAVRQVLPARAKATQNLPIGCGSLQGFLEKPSRSGSVGIVPLGASDENLHHQLENWTGLRSDAARPA
jgi:hypothetical protein